jgi:hypothetical protein
LRVTTKYSPHNRDNNLQDIQQPKLQVFPRERHHPIIVSGTEQVSHRSGERKCLSKIEKKGHHSNPQELP